jgi:predicted transcriptional regulator
MMAYKYLIDRLNMEWIYQIFSIVDYRMSIEKIVELSKEDGVEFGKRRDVFNRLVDLGLLEKTKEEKIFCVEFTELGQKVKNIYIKNSQKITMLLHMMHILKSFEKETPRYFSTYYYITKIALEDKKSSKDQYDKLVKLLEKRYPDEDHITGLDSTTIGKASVFFNELLDEDYSYLSFVDPIIFASGLQMYIEAKTSTPLGNVLITPKEKQELSILFLVSPDRIESMIDKSNRYTRAFETRYSTTGVVLNSLKKIEF